ncbi:repressor of RNA polymerase III transcription MAF1 homolog [Numida meleagris]|uniref:repressor of RNA polymerase III transcription MAF1 homolog n=1 Tax=Numida meleagris TaxID=8996 RepID=UPI000B3DE480|nr:repressor of RNA polymerase III transcription MAF1 homolog [Numida meleagris]
MEEFGCAEGVLKDYRAVEWLGWTPPQSPEQPALCQDLRSPPFFPRSGYAYTRPEASNELDMDLGEEDTEESGDPHDPESGSIEEDRLQVICM